MNTTMIFQENVEQRLVQNLISAMNMLYRRYSLMPHSYVSDVIIKLYISEKLYNYYKRYDFDRVLVEVVPENVYKGSFDLDYKINRNGFIHDFDINYNYHVIVNKYMDRDELFCISVNDDNVLLHEKFSGIFN